MKLRASWVCIGCAAIGFCNWYAFAQDDVEIPGLGFPRGRALVLQEIAAAVPAIPEPDDLPDDAAAILDAHAKEAADIRRKAEQEIATRRDKVVKALQVLQDKYTREAKLDEAVAIRDRIRKMKVAHLKPIQNPGSMTAYVNRLNQSFFVDIIGNTNGGVWGTEFYTYDSTLAAACVHAGVLKHGQRGIVKVTMIRSPNAHTGSTLNGVRSSDWGVYPASYTLELANPSDTTQGDPSTDAPASQ